MFLKINKKVNYIYSITNFNTILNIKTPQKYGPFQNLSFRGLWKLSMTNYGSNLRQDRPQYFSLKYKVLYCISSLLSHTVYLLTSSSSLWPFSPWPWWSWTMALVGSLSTPNSVIPHFIASPLTNLNCNLFPILDWEPQRFWIQGW